MITAKLEKISPEGPIAAEYPERVAKGFYVTSPKPSQVFIFYLDQTYRRTKDMMIRTSTVKPQGIRNLPGGVTEFDTLNSTYRLTPAKE